MDSPALRWNGAEPPATPALEALALTKVFGRSRRRRRTTQKAGVRAVDNVSISLQEGEILCVVGESGSGKTTLARLIMGLESPDSGQVLLRGTPVVQPGVPMPRDFRRAIQFVPQDPYANLDPRMTVGRIVQEGWRVHKGIVNPPEFDAEALNVLASVGLAGDDVLKRYPHELSGGQRQRVAIARALAVKPSVLVLDEPVSALDVSVQAQVLRLLQDLQSEQRLTYLLIAHDLSVVEYLATTIAVMYSGRIVEVGSARGVTSQPNHPYTNLLLRASPRWRASGTAYMEPPPGVDRSPDPLTLDAACVFYDRCNRRSDKCVDVDPHDHWRGADDREFACHHPIVGREIPMSLPSSD